MQHKQIHTHHPSALTRLPAIMLQTLSSVIITALFCTILFYRRANSELPLMQTSLLNSNDIKLILVLICGCMLFALVPSLLAAVFCSYFVWRLPRFLLSAAAAAAAAIIAFSVALLQNWLFSWPLDWIPILFNALAAAISALCVSRLQQQAQKK